MNIRGLIFKIFKGTTLGLGGAFVSFSFILSADLIDKLSLFGVGAILLIAVYLLQYKNLNIYGTLCVKAITLFLFVWIFFDFGAFGLLSYSLSFVGVASLLILIILKLVDVFVYGNVDRNFTDKKRVIDKIN